MRDPKKHKTFSLILIICSGFVFLFTSFLAWMLDSFVWEWLEIITDNDPFFLSGDIKFLIAHLKTANLGLLIVTGLFVALGLGFRFLIPGFRQGLVLLFGIMMFACLGFPILEWKILDDLFVDPESTYKGFEGSLLTFKLLTGGFSILMAILFAMGIDRLTGGGKIAA